ncbi:MAG: thiamine phosphate synthase [Actinobacteria bacterium]|nr:thiamine phosphate synthase [Actinomycetota bacterium]
MKLHAIVSDLETANTAVAGGATVLQLRLKGRPTPEVVDEGRPFRHLCALHGVTFVVNDDCEAAVELGADGVHLGQDDDGAEAAVKAGLMLGTSAANVGEAAAGVRLGAAYIGAGPVWATPSKPDAASPIGLDGLASICDSVSVPVIAIGGIDASNAADCLAVGAAGVAVVRAAANARAVRAAIDEALAAR